MILLVYGTRPEYIKIRPLMLEMTKNNINHKTLFTGQHTTLVDNNADFNLKIDSDSNNRLDSIIKACMNLPNEIFDEVKYILVQGDTTSVVGFGLAAMHRQIKIIHLEAGLRTHDTMNPYPEEYNRRLISSIADIHLCPTEENRLNLISEGIENDKIFVVGNTGLDNLITLKENITYKNHILVTLHRRENHETIFDWFVKINDIAKTYPDHKFIFPIHPNPNVQKYKSILTNVNVIEPLSHNELLDVLLSAKFVITDSGGLQEECSFLQKKCIVCRKITERPESIGDTTFMAKQPSDLDLLVQSIINNPKPLNLNSPFGDGKSSERICRIFKNLN